MTESPRSPASSSASPAGTARGPIATAGIAGLVAGAVSMALGEFVSVSSQRDSEHALLAKERAELRDDPDAELVELAAIYRAKLLSERTSQLVAAELSANDACAAHADTPSGEFLTHRAVHMSNRAGRSASTSPRQERHTGLRVLGGVQEKRVSPIGRINPLA